MCVIKSLQYSEANTLKMKDVFDSSAQPCCPPVVNQETEVVG